MGAYHAVQLARQLYMTALCEGMQEVVAAQSPENAPHCLRRGDQGLSASRYRDRRSGEPRRTRRGRFQHLLDREQIQILGDQGARHRIEEAAPKAITATWQGGRDRQQVEGPYILVEPRR